MATPSWADIFKLWAFEFDKDPTEKRNDAFVRMQGAAVTQPDALQNLQAGEGGSFHGSQRSPIRIRLGDSTDFIDLSSATNRMSRYTEYDRLQNVAEIETALNTFADEACVWGRTMVATPFGFFRIEDLYDDCTAAIDNYSFLFFQIVL